jgi:signal transduction histidine kinase
MSDDRDHDDPRHGRDRANGERDERGERDDRDRANGEHDERGERDDGERDDGERDDRERDDRQRDGRERDDLRHKIERGVHDLRDDIERKVRAYSQDVEDRQWEKVERAWRKHVEQRERREARRAQHHERWKRRRHRRWKELHDEREMWMRMRKDNRGWGPWWLQARMRKRIFIWLAFAFMSGAFAMNYWESARWWHAIAALIGLSIMSGAIAFRLTRPLLMVIRAARDIGDGKLETRLDIDHHRGETRVLAMAINDMAERIEQQLKDQRQLLAAVSHELRTPLGHMRVLIDTARAANDRKALGELEREVLVLDDLVGRLLASSRLEFGNLDCRPLDLGALVSDVATAAGVAPEAIEAIGDVRASVDPTLVRRAVANLLDNARVHGGGAVAVRIERRARQVAIEVDDAGPGMPADRRADAFRAFVPSHNGGLGLGLALVSRIAVAHGGGAWISDRPGGGTRVGFTVELAPRTDAA